LGIASEIWSATAAPVQHAAALAFTEPPELAERIARSRSLHAAVCRAAAGGFAAAGLEVRPPQAAFYLYPGFHARRGATRRPPRRGDGHGPRPSPAGPLRHGRPARQRVRRRQTRAAAPGRHRAAVRDTAAQRELALTSPDPLTLPWIAAAPDRIEAILAALAPSHHTAQPA